MYLRVSVTDRCNFRCTYSLPEDARCAFDAAIRHAIGATAPPTRFQCSGVLAEIGG